MRNSEIRVSRIISLIVVVREAETDKNRHSISKVRNVWHASLSRHHMGKKKGTRPGGA